MSSLADVFSAIRSTGGAKRRERAYQLLEAGGVDRLRLRDILARRTLPDVILNDDAR